MITKKSFTDKDGNELNIRPEPENLVSVKQAGNITEIKYMTHRSRGGTTRKISKDEYVDTRSGEVKLFHHQTKRTDDTESISDSIKRFRDVVRANCTEPEKSLFVTLTYADNMTNHKKLYNDYKNFLKRLPSEISPYKWLSAVEPQHRGAWHIHTIFIYKDKAPFIENKVISNAWKQGFVKIKAVDSVDDMGAYLCAYLTDIEVSNDTETTSRNIKTVKDKNGNLKRYIKGGRLSMYPAGMHIFRKSKNCIIPEKKMMISKEADKLVVGQTLVYEKTTEIEDTDSHFTNTINTRVYNSMRKAEK